MFVYGTYLRCDGCGTYFGTPLYDFRALPQQALGLARKDGWHRINVPGPAPRRLRHKDFCATCVGERRHVRAR